MSVALAENPRERIGADEKWSPVSIAPEYAISNLGRVKRIQAGRTRRAGTILTPSLRRKDGYLSVCLRIENKSKNVFLNVLACTAFHGPKPTPEHQAAHWDGNKLNNRSDNLRWATPLENQADKLRHGTVLRGDAHPARRGLQKILSGDGHWTASRPDWILRGERVGTSKLKIGRAHV